jgi:hypothetical protein
MLCCLYASNLPSVVAICPSHVPHNNAASASAGRRLVASRHLKTFCLKTFCLRHRPLLQAAALCSGTPTAPW